MKHRGKHEAGHRQREHRGTHSRRGSIESENRRLEPAGHQREAEDEQQVAQDASGDGCLDQVDQSGAERHDRDDQLRGVPEGRVE